MSGNNFNFNFLSEIERNLSIIRILSKYKEHKLFPLEVNYQHRRMKVSDAFFRGERDYVGESYIENFYGNTMDVFNKKFLTGMNLIGFIYVLNKRYSHISKTEYKLN